jgi:hypothetical protein
LNFGEISVFLSKAKFIQLLHVEIIYYWAFVDFAFILLLLLITEACQKGQRGERASQGHEWL